MLSDSSASLSFYWCGIHDRHGPGRCPECAASLRYQEQLDALRDRQDAIVKALNSLSNRSDMVSDQSDRQDTALTELESKLADIEDAHNRAVAHGEELSEQLGIALWLFSIADSRKSDNR